MTESLTLAYSLYDLVLLYLELADLSPSCLAYSVM